jgi:hypothetical protein
MKRFLAVSGVLVASAMTQAQFGSSLNNVPAFHDQAPAKSEDLPAILSQKQLADAGLTEAAQKESYKAAIRTSAIAYQLPCYCYCDRNHGHKSLRHLYGRGAVRIQDVQEGLDGQDDPRWHHAR